MKIRLNMINDINIFSKTCSQYYEGDISVKQGWQVINAKSLLGLYSLDLSQPVEVSINTDDKKVAEDFYNYIKKWEVK